MDDLDAAIALVYAQPPSGFVAARSALVKELKAARRKDQAARVAALRRPTKLAWAVGEAVRQAPEAAATFFAAVDALAEPAGSGGTTQPAGSGGTTQPSLDLRERTRDLRQAVASIVRGAEGVDHGDATAALLAVAADPEATGALRHGRLADIPAGGGFGGLVMGSGAPAAEEAQPRKAKTEKTAAEAEEATRRQEEARQRAERVTALGAERAHAAEAEAAATVRVEAARAAIDAAQAELTEATAALNEKRSALHAVAERVQQADVASTSD